jgi:hypothetical protein
MLFTVSVDLAEAGYFEFSTESIFHLAEIAQMLGNMDIVDEDEDFEEEIEISEDIDHLFAEGEEYVYDEDAECFCWYDAEYDVWYWLDEESGEWLLVEEEAEDEEAEEA